MYTTVKKKSFISTGFELARHSLIAGYGFRLGSLHYFQNNIESYKPGTLLVSEVVLIVLSILIALQHIEHVGAIGMILVE
jgi:hypothetical protein